MQHQMAAALRPPMALKALMAPMALVALVALVALGTTAPALAQNQAAHQHGVASLQVALERDALTITLDSPLDNLLGFERGPRNDAERARVRAMAQRLHDAGALLQPDAAAACRLLEVTLASSAIEPALLARGSAPSTPAGTAKAADGHADLDATFTYQCGQPLALKRLAVDGLFKAFPRLRKIDAAVVAPGVQRGFKLGPKQPVLAW